MDNTAEHSALQNTIIYAENNGTVQPNSPPPPAPPAPRRIQLLPRGGLGPQIQSGNSLGQGRDSPVFPLLPLRPHLVPALRLQLLPLPVQVPGWRRLPQNRERAFETAGGGVSDRADRLPAGTPGKCCLFLDQERRYVSDGSGQSAYCAAQQAEDSLPRDHSQQLDGHRLDY